MHPIVCIGANSKWAQLHVSGLIIDVNGPNCMYWIQLLILVPISGSQSHLGPETDHVFGTNDHVFAPNLRQPIILRSDTVNQSYCIVYFTPSWAQVTYPGVLTVTGGSWAHPLYESQSEGLTFRTNKSARIFEIETMLPTL